MNAELRRELRTTSHLAAPLILGQLSTGLTTFVDNVIAGHHSTRTLASVTVGTAVMWLPLSAVLGTLMSIPPLVSALHGAKKPDEIARTFRQSLWLGLALGPLLFAFVSLAPLSFARFGISPEIAPGATAFLHGMRWGLPAFTLLLVMRYTSDGLGHTLPTMLLGFGGLVLLLPLGYVLTFGRFGIPELGASGLGLASATVIWCQALALAGYLARARRFRSLGLFARFEGPRASELWQLLGTGLPIGFTVFLEGSSFILAALLIGRMGEVPAAAHQVAINVASLCFMIPLGLSEATTVRVGFALGARNGAALRRSALSGFLLLGATQLSTFLVLFFLKGKIVTLYTRDAAVLLLAERLLLYAALFQFSDGIQVLSNGALRGLRDTRVPMVLAAIAYWAVGIPLGAHLAFGRGLGPSGMWLGLIAGLTLAAVLLGSRFARRVGRALG